MVVYDNFGKQHVIAVGATEASFLKQVYQFIHNIESKLSVQILKISECEILLLENIEMLKKCCLKFKYKFNL